MINLAHQGRPPAHGFCNALWHNFRRQPEPRFSGNTRGAHIDAAKHNGTPDRPAGLSSGLEADQLLVEQLRLVMGNVASGVLPTFLAVSLVGVILAGSVPLVPLCLWCLSVLGSKLALAWDARKRLARGIPTADARRLASRLTLVHGIDGVIWASLAWISLDHTSLTGSVLVISALAAVLGGTVSSLSPVLKMFVVFATVLLVTGVAKLWTMGSMDYVGVGGGALLYGVNLIAQARSSSRAARASIELRFQNLALIDSLRAETLNAEEANRVKSKFLAAASHDLRQPIHAQGLFLEVLAGTPLAPRQTDILESARSASRASGEMLDTLLDFSRIEAGVLKPQPRPFSLQAVLSKIENDLAPLADAKGLAFRVVETTAVAQSDPALVEMILRNLVSNAIRYTERGGVLITCRKRGSEVMVSVYDTGVGIAEEHQQEVFREFHQLGNPERDRRNGLGLGLAIAHGLSGALGHALTLRSHEGRGSTFRLALPRLPFSSAELIPDAPAAQLGGRLLQGVHALVIEDDETVRLGMRLLLESWGCECDTASSLADAQIHALRCMPDIIISDYRLRKQGTGAEAIATIGELWGTQIPALIVTRDTAPERLREALASGIPLLHKPVSARHLHQTMIRMLKKEQLEF